MFVFFLYEKLLLRYSLGKTKKNKKKIKVFLEIISQISKCLHSPPFSIPFN